MSGMVGPNLTVTFIALFAVLSAGTVVRLVTLAGASDESARAQRQSLVVWWILAVLLAAAVALGPLGICVLLGVASWVSLDEYAELVVGTDVDARTLGLLFALVPLTYLAIFLGLGPRTVLWLPLASLLAVAGSLVARGHTDGYVRTTGALVLGSTLVVFGPAHAALLVTLPAESPVDVVGGAGWLVYLVLLTALNDIAQAVVGRRIGRHRIAPVVSPNKSWEGYLAGLVVTCGAAVLAAPYLTPLATRPAPESASFGPLQPFVWPLLAGVLINVTGFLGDLNMSAIKRDLGVDDSGTLLEGMGGALDRIDSLTLTAPCFYWLIAAGPR